MTDNVKNHFEEEAEIFDSIIGQLIPYYSHMLEAVVSNIPLSSKDKVRVVDLGCGTGTLAYYVKQRFPKAHVTCVDFAENMLKMARIKLKSCKDIEYKLSDIDCVTFDEPVDAVISSLAVHHLATPDKKVALFSRIFDSLTNGGVFINADIVLGADDYFQNVNIAGWKRFMQKSVDPEDVENIWLEKYRNEDYPEVLIDQIEWLKKIEFRVVDIFWKHYNFAVYGGIK